MTRVLSSEGARITVLLEDLAGEDGEPLGTALVVELPPGRAGVLVAVTGGAGVTGRLLQGCADHLRAVGRLRLTASLPERPAERRQRAGGGQAPAGCGSRPDGWTCPSCSGFVECRLMARWRSRSWDRWRCGATVACSTSAGPSSGRCSPSCYPPPRASLDRMIDELGASGRTAEGDRQPAGLRVEPAAGARRWTSPPGRRPASSGAGRPGGCADIEAGGAGRGPVRGAAADVPTASRGR